MILFKKKVLISWVFFVQNITKRNSLFFIVTLVVFINYLLLALFHGHQRKLVVFILQFLPLMPILLAGGWGQFVNFLRIIRLARQSLNLNDLWQTVWLMYLTWFVNGMSKIIPNPNRQAKNVKFNNIAMASMM